MKDELPLDELAEAPDLPVAILDEFGPPMKRYPNVSPIAAEAYSPVAMSILAFDESDETNRHWLVAGTVGVFGLLVIALLGFSAYVLGRNNSENETESDRIVENRAFQNRNDLNIDKINQSEHRRRSEQNAARTNTRPTPSNPLPSSQMGRSRKMGQENSRINEVVEQHREQMRQANERYMKRQARRKPSVLPARPSGADGLNDESLKGHAHAIFDSAFGGDDAVDRASAPLEASKKNRYEEMLKKFKKNDPFGG